MCYGNGRERAPSTAAGVRPWQGWTTTAPSSLSWAEGCEAGNPSVELREGLPPTATTPSLVGAGSQGPALLASPVPQTELRLPIILFVEISRT